MVQNRKLKGGYVCIFLPAKLLISGDLTICKPHTDDKQTPTDFIKN